MRTAAAAHLRLCQGGEEIYTVVTSSLESLQLLCVWTAMFNGSSQLDQTVSATLHLLSPFVFYYVITASLFHHIGLYWIGDTFYSNLSVQSAPIQHTCSVWCVFCAVGHLDSSLINIFCRSSPFALPPLLPPLCSLFFFPALPALFLLTHTSCPPRLPTANLYSFFLFFCAYSFSHTSLPKKMRGVNLCVCVIYMLRKDMPTNRLCVRDCCSAAGKFKWCIHCGKEK